MKEKRVEIPPRIRKISRTIFLPERVTRRASRNENEKREPLAAGGRDGGGERSRGWKWTRRKMRYGRSCCAFPDIRNSIKRVKSNVLLCGSFQVRKLGKLARREDLGVLTVMS